MELREGEGRESRRRRTGSEGERNSTERGGKRDGQEVEVEEEKMAIGVVAMAPGAAAAIVAVRSGSGLWVGNWPSVLLFVLDVRKIITII